MSQQVVDRQLERALRAYERELLTRQTLVRTFSAVAVVWLGARVLTLLLGVAPAHGWLGTPWSLTLLAATVAAAICRSFALNARAPHLLDKLRTGPAIEHVRRDVAEVPMRIGFIRVNKQVSTVFVDFIDGRTLSVTALADVEQLDRIAVLLRKQQEQQSARS